MERVTRKREVAFLVTVFERYPLRAKKRHDVVVWSEAVRLWLDIRTRRRHDWSRIAALRDELRAGKVYDAPAAPIAPADEQLQLAG